MKSLLTAIAAISVFSANISFAEPEVFMSFDFKNGAIEQGFDEWVYSDKGENPCGIYNGVNQSKFCSESNFKFYPYYNSRNSDHMGWLKYGYIDADTQYAVRGTSLKIHLTGGMYKSVDGLATSDGKEVRSKSDFSSSADLGKQGVLPGDIALYYKGPTSTTRIPQLQSKNRFSVWVLMPRNSVDIDSYSKKFYSAPLKSFSFYPFVDSSKGAHYYHHVANIPLGGWTKMQFDASPTNKNTGAPNNLYAFSEGGTEYSNNAKEYFSNITAFALRADFSKRLPANSVYYIDEIETHYTPYENEETIKSISVGYSPTNKLFDISLEDKYRCLDCSAIYEVRYSFSPIDNTNFDQAFLPAHTTNFDRQKSNNDGLIHKANNGYNLIWAMMKLQDDHEIILKPNTKIYFAVKDITNRKSENHLPEDLQEVNVPNVGLVSKVDLVKTIEYEIVDVNYPLEINTDDIENPIVGYIYDQHIQVEGGKAPYDLKAINLPDGITLTDHKLAGVVSQPDAKIVKLSVIDSMGSLIDAEVNIEVHSEDSLYIKQCQVIADFDELNSTPSQYFDKVFHDVYTNIYQTGMTTVVGSNGTFNYQGVTGLGLALFPNDAIHLVWRNVGTEDIVFAPKLSFATDSRFVKEEQNDWMNLAQTIVKPDNIAVTRYPVGEFKNINHVNVNSNFSNYKTLILERIEIVSKQFSIDDNCSKPTSFKKAKYNTDLSLSNYQSS